MSIIIRMTGAQACAVLHAIIVSREKGLVSDLHMRAAQEVASKLEAALAE